MPHGKIFVDELESDAVDIELASISEQLCHHCSLFALFFGVGVDRLHFKSAFSQVNQIATQTGWSRIFC